MLLAFVAILYTAKADNISLLISLPLHQDIISVPYTGWRRGLEILPGAIVAVKGINENSSVLPGYIICRYYLWIVAVMNMKF